MSDPQGLTLSPEASLNSGSGKQVIYTQNSPRIRILEKAGFVYPSTGHGLLCIQVSRQPWPQGRKKASAKSS